MSRPARTAAGMRATRVALLVAVVLARAAAGQPAGSPSPAPVLVVHLPSSSVEAPSRLAEAAAALTEHLEATAPGLAAEPEVFRRLEDVQAYLAAEAPRVGLVLAEPALLLDRAAGLELVPVQRLRVAGGGTHRRVVVVPRRAEARVLADLRDQTLAVAASAGEGLESYLEHAVFAGEASPRRWFSTLARTDDDFAAVAAVLYDQTAAALIAEHNPLLESKRGQLRVIYRSEPLSLPVLAYNPARIDAAARSRLDRALADLDATSAGGRAKRLLAIDGFEPLGEELARALLRPPATPPKILATAVPGARAIPPPILEPPPSPADLRWPLPLSLPPPTEEP